MEKPIFIPQHSLSTPFIETRLQNEKNTVVSYAWFINLKQGRKYRGSLMDILSPQKASTSANCRWSCKTNRPKSKRHEIIELKDVEVVLISPPLSTIILFWVFSAPDPSFGFIPDSSPQEPPTDPDSGLPPIWDTHSDTLMDSWEHCRWLGKKTSELKTTLKN